jgi:benzoylformate decarboxylase
MDVLDEINEEEVFPSCVPSTRVIPNQSWINEVAENLVSSKTPIIFAGDGVAYSQATEELTELAELIGAEVYGVEFGDVLMDSTHPLYQGSTGHMFGESSFPITSKGDVNLVVGTYMLPEVFPRLEGIYAPDAKVIHIDLNAYEIAKNHRVDMGVVADPKLTLQALIDQISLIQTDDHVEKANAVLVAAKRIKEEKLAQAIAADEAMKSDLPMHMSVFAKALSEQLPSNAIIFDEALTNSPAVSRYMPATTPGSYFYTRGGSLGIGIPGAIGVKLNNPSKTVIGFTGDGGSMYTIQALWTAVRHQVGAKFVICNNGSYHLLQLNIDQYWKERTIEKHEFP